MQLTAPDRTRAAAAYVDAKIGFYVHLAAYVLVNALLIFLNYREGGEWWSVWPVIGWGLGILGHAFGVFGTTSPAFVRWRLRNIDRARSSL